MPFCTHAVKSFFRGAVTLAAAILICRSEAHATSFEIGKNLTSDFTLSFVRANGAVDYQLSFDDVNSRLNVHDDDGNGYGTARLFTQDPRSGTFTNNLTGASSLFVGQFNINLDGLDTGPNPELANAGSFAIGQKGELQNRTGYEDIIRVFSPELSELLGYYDPNLAFGLTPKFRDPIHDANHDGVDDNFGTIINYREFDPTTGLWSYSPDYLPFGFIAGYIPQKGRFSADAWFMSAGTYMINGVAYQLRGDFHGREVPEPATLLLMGTGILGLGAARRRKSIAA